MFRHLFTTLLAVITLNAAAVDVNRASQAELETVKGIGPGLSGKILDARKTGTFKDWTDFVDRVAGVGPGNASKFSQAGLTVGEKTYVAMAEAPAKPARSTKAEKADKPEKAGKSERAEKAAK